MLLLFARDRIQREITDIQGCTVCSQSGLHTRRYAGAEVTSDGSSAYQHDLRLELVDHRCQSMCIRLCTVYFQFLVIDYDYFVSAVNSQLICQPFHIVTNQDCHYFLTQVIGEVFCLTQQLKSNRADFIIYLLSKYIYIFVLLN